MPATLRQCTDFTRSTTLGNRSVTSAKDLPLAPVRHRRRRRRFAARETGILPVLRLGAFALRTLVASIAAAVADLWRSEEARRRHRADRRQRTLLRGVAILGDLKGAFAKAGQFASVRHDLLPEPAMRALAELQDRVPPLSFEPIRDLIESELGAPLEDLFQELDSEPLGAASVAQVHRGRLPGGAEVAVKVQYPWLEASLAADLWILRTSVRGFALVRGRRFDPGPLFGEFENGLRDELDFRREADMAGEIAANLAEDPRVVVPEVIATHSSRRVLTMRYRPAIPIRDRDALLARGIDPAALLEILGRAYAKQVFVDGLFHADPHPGNLFVLDEPEARERPRLLFVDFGLSRRLDPDLRREMRLGVYALLQRDIDAFMAGMARMNMVAPGSEDAVRAAITRMFERLERAGATLGLGGAQVLSLKDEAKALLQDTPGVQLPNDLLLFAKTLSYLFALGSKLAPEVDLMKVSLPYLLRFLSEREAQPAVSGLNPRRPGEPAEGPAGG